MTVTNTWQVKVEVQTVADARPYYHFSSPHLSAKLRLGFGRRGFTLSLDCVCGANDWMRHLGDGEVGVQYSCSACTRWSPVPDPEVIWVWDSERETNRWDTIPAFLEGIIEVEPLSAIMLTDFIAETMKRLNTGSDGESYKERWGTDSTLDEYEARLSWALTPA